MVRKKTITATTLEETLKVVGENLKLARLRRKITSTKLTERSDISRVPYVRLKMVKAASQMNGYPMPIIDEKIARKSAAKKIYNLRKNNTNHKEIAQKIVSKHGSRKSSLPRTAFQKRMAGKVVQGELPL